MLTLVLQKAISFSQTFPTLNDEKNENLEKILEKTRTTKDKFNITLANLSTEISALTQKDKDNIVDDCYALLLQSAYYPEYRRYIETLHRFIYLSNIHTIETLFEILFQKDGSLTLNEFAILRQLLNGRILLPQNVETDSKPLPQFKNGNNDTEEVNYESIKDYEAVIGVSLRVQKPYLQKVNIKPIPNKKNVKEISNLKKK